MSLITTPTQLGLNIGKCRNGIDIIAQSDSNQSCDVGDGQWLKSEGALFNITKGVRLRLARKVAVQLERPCVVGTREATRFTAPVGNLSTAMGARIAKCAQHTIIGTSNEYWMAGDIFCDKGSGFGKLTSPTNDVGPAAKENVKFFLESNWVGKNSCWLSH